MHDKLFAHTFNLYVNTFICQTNAKQQLVCLCACVVEKNGFKSEGILIGDSDTWLQQIQLDIDKMTKEEVNLAIGLKRVAYETSQGNAPNTRALKGYPENEIYSEFKKRGVKFSEDPDPEMKKAVNAALATCVMKVKYHFCVCVCVFCE